MATTTERPAPRLPVGAPARSLTQRREALQRANEIRCRRAELKRDITGGRRSVRDLLLDPPGYIDTMAVFDLLLAAPKVGRVKANKALSACRISPRRTVGGVTERQRRELAGLVRRWR